MQIAEQTSSDVDSDYSASLMLYDLGRCLMKMDKFAEARMYLEKSLKIKIKISCDPDSDSNVAITLNELETCLAKLKLN